MGILGDVLSVALPVAGAYFGGPLGASLGSVGNQLLGSAGNIASSALGYYGQQSTNQANIDIAQQSSAASAEQAQKQMDFQERMSNTSYQRGVKDMEAAGLNPMLAYSQGGATTPSGAQGQVFNPTIGNKWAAAMQNASQAAVIQNTQADTEVKHAQAEKTKQETLTSGASAGQMKAHTDQIRQQMQKFEDEWDLLKKQARKTYYEGEGAKYEAGIKSSADQEAQRQQQARTATMRAEAQKLQAQAELYGLDIPRGLAEAAYWRSNYGKASPYIDSGVKNIGSLVQSAAQAKRAFGSRTYESATERAPDGSTSTWSRTK